MFDSNGGTADGTRTADSPRSNSNQHCWIDVSGEDDVRAERGRGSVGMVGAAAGGLQLLLEPPKCGLVDSGGRFYRGPRNISAQQSLDGSHLSHQYHLPDGPPDGPSEGPSDGPPAVSPRRRSRASPASCSSVLHLPVRVAVPRPRICASAPVPSSWPGTRRSAAVRRFPRPAPTPPAAAPTAASPANSPRRHGRATHACGRSNSRLRAEMSRLPRCDRLHVPRFHDGRARHAADREQPDRGAVRAGRVNALGQALPTVGEHLDH